MTADKFKLLSLVSALRYGLKVSPSLVSDIVLKIKKENVLVDNFESWVHTHFPNIGTFSSKHLDDAFIQIEDTLQLGIKCLLISDDDYPNWLRLVESPPAVLFLRGNLSIVKNMPGLAVVGTRKATINGLKIAERIAFHFSELGIPIVSGLALGIDAAAHKGALRGSGCTIAVLAHGLETASPRANSNLANEILEHGGAWVSEYPVGIPARPEQFVFRNRIQIGLSTGSVIVEGEIKSGSMTQAEFCLRNSRELFAVMEPKDGVELGLLNEGTKLLVEKRGAFPIYSKLDYEEMGRRIAHRKDLIVS